MTAPRSVLIRIRNVSDKNRRKNQNTHFMFNSFFFGKSCRFLDNNVENTVQPDRPQMTIWRMRIASWAPKTTNTHSKYVKLISLPLQQWLHEGVESQCQVTRTALSRVISKWHKNHPYDGGLLRRRSADWCLVPTSSAPSVIRWLDVEHLLLSHRITLIFAITFYSPYYKILLISDTKLHVKE